MAEYQNPINEVPMVTVPKWEYAQLVGKASMLEMLGKLTAANKKYVVVDMLEVLFNGKCEEDE